MTSLHDWTLKSILYEWKLARVTIVFDNLRALDARVVANGVVDLHIPQRREWGPSASVNKLIGPSEMEAGSRRLTIEMQSGDAITITAATFDLPSD
jgi:hypothetical protein